MGDVERRQVTDCVNEVSACTSDCETAAQRTEVVIVAPTYGGAACAELSMTDCESGDGHGWGGWRRLVAEEYRARGVKYHFLSRVL